MPNLVPIHAKSSGSRSNCFSRESLIFLGGRRTSRSGRNDRKVTQVIAAAAHPAHRRGMIDSFLARADVAIEESRALQSRSRALRAERVSELHSLRMSIFESGMS